MECIYAEQAARQILFMWSFARSTSQTEGMTLRRRRLLFNGEITCKVFPHPGAAMLMIV